jgi:pimeloyl-ACP methyl ester carboxylesterase
MTMSLGLLLISILALSCLSTSIFKQQDQVLAQPYIQTIKYRNLVIDLGNGVKTNAQLTLPAVGKGPFPGVLLIAGTGPTDKNETLGLVLKDKPPPDQPLLQIAKYLSERGFAVLRYDKRGVGGNLTIADKNIWGNATINDFIHDADKALNVLIAQPEVNGTKKITIIGHSEGTVIAPRIAVNNPTKVKNIILIGAQAQNMRDAVYFQWVYLPLLYAEKILDHNHNGSISI